jgi:hypothetical protein
MSRFRSRLSCLLRFHGDALDQNFALFQKRWLTRPKAVFEPGLASFTGNGGISMSWLNSLRFFRLNFCSPSAFQQ